MNRFSKEIWAQNNQEPSDEKQKEKAFYEKGKKELEEHYDESWLENNIDGDISLAEKSLYKEIYFTQNASPAKKTEFLKRIRIIRNPQLKEYFMKLLDGVFNDLQLGEEFLGNNKTRWNSIKNNDKAVYNLDWKNCPLKIDDPYFDISNREIKRFVSLDLSKINIHKNWPEIENAQKYDINDSANFISFHAQRIARLVQEIQNGQKLKPLEISFRGTIHSEDCEIEIIDGNHRLRAYQYLDINPIPVVVKEGNINLIKSCIPNFKINSIEANSFNKENFAHLEDYGRLPKDIAVDKLDSFINHKTSNRFSKEVFNQDSKNPEDVPGFIKEKAPDQLNINSDLKLSLYDTQYESSLKELYKKNELVLEKNRIDVPSKYDMDFSEFMKAGRDTTLSYVILHGDKVIGMIELLCKYWPHILIEIWIDKDYHGRGLGQQVLKGAHAIIFDTLDGLKILQHITKDNNQSQRNVEKMDYKGEPHLFRPDYNTYTLTKEDYLQNKKSSRFSKEIWTQKQMSNNESGREMVNRKWSEIINLLHDKGDMRATYTLNGLINQMFTAYTFNNATYENMCQMLDQIKQVIEKQKELVTSNDKTIEPN